MGNCIKKDSSLQFGGEDWSFAASEKFLPNEEISYDYRSSIKGEEEELKTEKKANFPPFSANGSEVKIKISKKQLEELVKRSNLEGLTIQEVVLQLMDVGDSYEIQRQRSWRPALKSIPESEVN